MADRTQIQLSKEIKDALISSPQNYEGLIYKNGVWENDPIPAISGVQISGAIVAHEPYLNFLGGVTLVDDPGNNRTNITVIGNGGTSNVTISGNGYLRKVETLSGTTHFDTTQTFSSGSLRVYVNGLLENPTNVTPDGNARGFTLAFSASGDEVQADYDYASGNVSPSTLAHVIEGRLTVSSGVSIPTTDITNAVTLYYTEHIGNTIALYYNSSWQVLQFNNISISLSGKTANTNYDVFCYANNGTTPTLELLAWTNATTRATGLIRQDGVYVKSGDATRRYLGTIRTTVTTGQCEDSEAKRYVWNAYNKVPRSLRKFEATANWTYIGNTVRPANNSTLNRVELVVGLLEASLDLSTAQAPTCTNNVMIINGVGEDVTNALATGIQGGASNVAANTFATCVSRLIKIAPLGYHFYQWVESGHVSGTTIFYGTNSGSAFGIIGTIEG